MGANPYSILTVTFTNKAASEMRGRIESIVEGDMGSFWCGTFHGLSHRMLKRFHKEAGLTSGFTILDSDDQLRIIKRIAKESNLDEASWPSRRIVSVVMPAGHAIAPAILEGAYDYFAEKDMLMALDLVHGHHGEKAVY